MQKNILFFTGSLTLLSCFSLGFVSYAAEEPIEPPKVVVIQTREEHEDSFDYIEVDYSQLDEIGTYTVTAYCGCEICCGKWASDNPITYTGTNATEGRTIASDGNSLGYGSAVYIEGLGERIVEDKPADKILRKYDGKIIDVYFDSHQDALNFGKQKLKVYRENEYTMTNKIVIMLSNSDKAIEFVQKANEFSEDLDLVDGRIEIDAKSIMGVCSLDLTKPLELRIHSDNEETIKQFNETFSQYMEG